MLRKNLFDDNVVMTVIETSSNIGSTQQSAKMKGKVVVCHESKMKKSVRTRPKACTPVLKIEYLVKRKLKPHKEQTNSTAKEARAPLS